MNDENVEVEESEAGSNGAEGAVAGSFDTYTLRPDGDGPESDEGVVVQLPLGTVMKIAFADLDSLSKLGAEWAIVFWARGEDEISIESFENRDDASEWLEASYARKDTIEAILHKGRPKKFEIEVKAKISLR